MNGRVSNLIKRLEETASKYDTEYADFNSLYESLLGRPEDDRGYFWARGSEILSTSEENINALADYYERMYDASPCTGFYDPIEDEKDGSLDELTGSYYLNLD